VGPDRNASAARLFELVRDDNPSGVVGPLVVATGVVFHDGSCVLRWAQPVAMTAFFATFADLKALYGPDGWHASIRFVAWSSS
jgi:hypothetical protein